MKYATGVLIQLLGWASGGFLVGLLIVSLLEKPVTARLANAPAAIQPQTGSAGHVFASDAGIMLKFIKPERTADFEATVARLKEALQRSNDPMRRRMAASWKVFRAVEPAANGDAVYVFEIDPAVKGADYTVSKILSETFPAEAQSLYQRYADSYSGEQNIVDLTLIASFRDNESR